MPRLQVEMGELEFRLCIEKAKEQFDKMRNDKLL
jgi:hypothetical protein